MNAPPEVPEAVRKTLERAQLEDEVGKQALAAPLPGPLDKVFAPEQTVKVGRWTVQPFYDAHFEFLVALQHPLADMMQSVFGGGESKESPELDQMPRGPRAWELAWIMTRPIDDVEAVIKKGGMDLVREQAKQEFSRLRLFDLIQLLQVIMAQVGVYWSPTKGYAEKPVATDGNGEEGVAQSPAPPLS